MPGKRYGPSTEDPERHWQGDVVTHLGQTMAYNLSRRASDLFKAAEMAAFGVPRKSAIGLSPRQELWLKDRFAEVLEQMPTEGDRSRAA